MIYIKKQLGFYFSEVQLGDTYNVGTTLEDYDNGAFLLLSDDQVAFHWEFPDATPLEVWNMEIPSSPEPEPPRTGHTDYRPAAEATGDSRSRQVF